MGVCVYRRTAEKSFVKKRDRVNIIKTIKLLKCTHSHIKYSFYAYSF